MLSWVDSVKALGPVPVELCSTAFYSGIVSVNVDTRIVGPGSDEYVDDAWRLKERIREREGVLKQRRGFFVDAYRRSTVYLLVEEPSTDERLIGFAATRRDGYILFLAIDEEYRGQGFGRQLVSAAAAEHKSVTCHARATNRDAIEFYQHICFEVERRVSNYYEDGGDAYYLRLGDEGLASKISKFVWR